MKQDDILIVAAIVLLGLILATCVIFIRRRICSGTLRPLLRAGGAVLFAVAIALALVFSFVCFILLMGPIGIIAWFILMAVLIEGTHKYRATRQYGLLWLLTVSAERSMPLVPAVEAFAQERRGWHSRQAKRLAELLNRGVPLPVALENCPGLLPPFSLPMIRVGHETGTLASALRQAASIHNRHEPLWPTLDGQISYLLFVPAFGFILVTFLMLKIVPMFEKIFADFGGILPPLTLGLIGIARLSIDYWYLFLPLYLLTPALLFYVPIRYFGWTYWDLPGMGRFTRRLDSAQILDTLALVAGQQRPLLEGFIALAQSYPKSKIRRRLQAAADDVAAGRDWCESLFRHGLIRQPELAVLHSAQRVGNLPWALHEMAESVRRRLVYRVQTIAQLIFPPIVILMGLVVLFVVVALFLPLVSLIEHLV
jgi:type II secretory pathway component PulF